MRKRVDDRIKKYVQDDFVEQEDPIIMEAKKQIDEYLEGQRRLFCIPFLPIGTDFQKRVWNELLKIEYGTTVSYLDIAKRIGKQKAVRAVASAISANAIALVIPCHRVVCTGGKPGGYAGGLTVKKSLLDIESFVR